MKIRLAGMLASMVLSCGLMNASAQDANGILNRVIEAYDNSKGIEASYSMTYDKTTDYGSIDMEGEKFRILSEDLKCWFDGKTQWAYSTMTDEVNVTEPTVDELQMSNPYIALKAFKDNSQNSVVITKDGSYLLSLIPVEEGDIKLIQLFIDKNKYQITKAVFSMVDNSMYTITVNNYVTGKKFSSKIFKYDSKYVPKGTQIVDLR